MSDKSQRTLTWWEGQYDTKMIEENNWNFQIAQAVASGEASAQTNVIWKSKALAPFTEISWKVQYALNWTAKLPTAGVEVRVYGKWQPCNKGQVFDLDSRGFWAPSTEEKKEGWLKVGKVNYKFPDVPGIHIVVGVLDAASGQYNTIFIDSARLPPGSHATYQPQEKITWWLEGGNHTGQVYNESSSRAASKDVSSPAPGTDKFEWWTSFLFNEAKWVISEEAPPQSFVAPPQAAFVVENSPVEIFLDPLGWVVLFGIAVATELRPDLVNYLRARLSQYFDGLEIRFRGSDGSSLTITYNAARGAQVGSFAAIGVVAGSSTAAGPKDYINTSLQGAVQSGKLAKDERWEIKPESASISDAPAVQEAS